MGAAIRASGISRAPDVFSSIAHAATAANACLDEAGIAPDDVGLLINVGVFRDRNIVEPAMSALIQKRLGIGLDYLVHPAPLFSFDLLNGAVGMMNAVHVAGSYLATGAARYALLVSSDAHPAGRQVEAFPYACVGGAFLLEASPRGFGRVHTRHSDEEAPGATASLRFGQAVPNGRERVDVVRAADYEERLLAFALEAARETARAEGISLARTWLVTSQPTPSFGARLCSALEAAGASAPADLGGDPHTSALAFGYRGVPPAGYDQLMFVAVGSGLTSACAIYRP